MSEKERAVCRGGSRNGVVMPVDAGQDRLYFVAGDSGRTNAVYSRTGQIEVLDDGPAVVFAAQAE